ncbi:hypothetical protein FISHEDRAFT_43311 [Fistulina hepatica ATCC 64428]|uniref:Uncharacterized protein n=1 Tax=Fistulina hepatica ATCC 64428 TaxID=1128425 RepID=A0A0D7AEY0_9AGAR|nr:hypothetical protein FISHEDRAFT_43311 [Fistulina hepatica ATCC 64428]
MIPSWHKVAARPDTLQLSVDEPAWAVYCTYRWVREVFDCYRAYMTARGPSATRPLVVDCDDMIANTRGVMRALCVHIGIDEGEVDYTWTPDMFPTHVPASTSGVNQVRIVFCNSDTQPKLAAEYQIWVKEWGVDTAKAIEVAALAAMRDYEYLRGFRLRPL